MSKTPRNVEDIRKEELYFCTSTKEYIYYDDTHQKNDCYLLEAFAHCDFESMRRFSIRFIDQYMEFLSIFSKGNDVEEYLYDSKEDINKDNYRFLLIKLDVSTLDENAKILYKKNLASFFSFLNNSSIWVRVVDNVDDEEKAKAEFQAIAKMKLYEYDSAKENFDFNCRIQLENMLVGDHGHDVTPILYGNESEFYKKLFE